MAEHINLSVEITKVTAEWCYPRDLIGDGVDGIGPA